MKQIIVLLLVSLLAVVFSGCREGNTKPDAPTPTVTQADTETYSQSRPTRQAEPEPPPAPVPEFHHIKGGVEFTASRVEARMKDIDDVGLVFVKHEDGGVILAAQTEWKYGLHGSAKVQLNDYLKSGENLVIFVLYDKEKQIFMHKWSFDFGLYGDGTMLFHEARESKGGKKGIVFWSAFSAEQGARGGYLLSKASDSQTRSLQPAFSQINADIANHPLSDNVSDIAARISVGLR